MFSFSPCSVIVLCFILFSTFFYVTTNGVFCENYSEGIVIKRVAKTSHLHFYFHDIVSGENKTVVKIAGPANTTGYGFGSTMMMDDILTEEAEPNSKIVGRAQGIYGMASKSDLSLLMVLTFVFMEGDYNGSSISVLGRNPVFQEVREMPVVGGSGVFRSANGYALAHTVWSDFKTGDAIVEYNAYVTHY